MSNHIQNIKGSNEGETKKDFILLLPTTPVSCLLLHENKLIYINIVGSFYVLQGHFRRGFGGMGVSAVWGQEEGMPKPSS